MPILAWALCWVVSRRRKRQSLWDDRNVNGWFLMQSRKCSSREGDPECRRLSWPGRPSKTYWRAWCPSWILVCRMKMEQEAEEPLRGPSARVMNCRRLPSVAPGTRSSKDLPHVAVGLWAPWAPWNAASLNWRVHQIPKRRCEKKSMLKLLHYAIFY